MGGGSDWIRLMNEFYIFSKLPFGPHMQVLIIVTWQNANKVRGKRIR